MKKRKCGTAPEVQRPGAPEGDELYDELTTRFATCLGFCPSRTLTDAYIGSGIRSNYLDCSVFHSELIAIDEAFASLVSLPNGKEIWILSDSRSAIQHLSNWHSWVPSHINLEGNDIADTLAKAGACEVPEPSAPLTFLDIFSRTRLQNKTAWIPPEHHWYQCSRPGGSLAHGFTRQDQTLLARFRSGHIKTMKFFEGRNIFEMCTN
ncbi:uncharacterized protein TNCV_1439741 [Trichonephila clavipes]|nr:uncharacterized protein TNCV_1439741 [Trichonephila clavipes]